MAGNGIHPFHPHQWPQPQLQPPQPVPSQVMNPNQPSTEEVRTIFITGLPPDVKEREIHNLLRWLPGFEASQLNLKTEPPMGFALFSSAHYAVAARDALQDMVFDAENKSVLHTEMAKKNLFVKRGIAGEANISFDQSKRLRTGGDFTPHSGFVNPSPSPFQPPPQPVWGHQGYIAQPPPQFASSQYAPPQFGPPQYAPPQYAPPQFAPPQYAPPQYDPYAATYQHSVPAVPMPAPAPAPLPAPSAYAPVQNSKDNPPCNTLFIGNLGENVIEDELKNLFSVQPGFKQMKILRQERNTVCFIKFDDVSGATQVHQNLQGAIIPSSGRGGMRIQFSKNPFGRRKDGFNTAGGPEANGALAQLFE